jgi:hypothetical protein
MSTYPTWDRKAEYLGAAEHAMEQVAADVAADTTNVWQSIDIVIDELHKLRAAAGSECIARQDAAMESSAALLARLSGERAGVES